MHDGQSLFRSDSGLEQERVWCLNWKALAEQHQKFAAKLLICAWHSQLNSVSIAFLPLGRKQNNSSWHRNSNHPRGDGLKCRGTVSYSVLLSGAALYYISRLFNLKLHSASHLAEDLTQHVFLTYRIVLQWRNFCFKIKQRDPPTFFWETYIMRTGPQERMQRRPDSSS